MDEFIMKVIVGSTALKCHLNQPRTSDLDVWTDKSPLELISGIDTSVMPKSILDLVQINDKEILDLSSNTSPSECYRIATLNSLYTIKCSHLGYDIFWQKHKKDLLILKHLGAELIPELYQALVKYWKQVHGDKEFLSLYKDKTEFFNDKVDYLYDHDYLHELVALPNKPVYKKCLKLDQEVLIDKEKFDIMDYSDQLRMFREEITVIAIERWMVNPKYDISYIKAYQYALRKTVTSLTKNWACEFIIQNMEHLHKPIKNDFEKCLNKLGVKMKQLEYNKAVELYTEMGDAYNETEIGKKYPVSGADDAFSTLILDEYEFSGLSILEQEGGDEGGAEYCYIVFKWKDKIYKHEYRYYSYNGHEFDISDVAEVFPVEKTITVYE